MDLFFGHGAAWFSVPALIGTFFFLLRMIMMMTVGDSDFDSDFDADVDIDGDFDLDGDVDLEGASDSTGDFTVLSLQAMAAFTMGFGWGGLGSFVSLGWGIPISILVGLATGSGMVWLLGKLLKLVYGFQSSGTVSIKDALGTEGTVYVTIPQHREGRGNVRLVIGERQRYYIAVTDGEAIESKARVRVAEVNDDNTVTVARV